MKRDEDDEPVEVLRFVVEIFVEVARVVVVVVVTILHCQRILFQSLGYRRFLERANDVKWRRGRKRARVVVVVLSSGVQHRARTRSSFSV